MEFGDTESLEDVDWDLPRPRWWDEEALKTVPKWFLGAPLWTHKGMIRALRTPSLEKKSALEIYAQNFNCIELNASYYAVPREEVVAHWCSQVPSDFRFFPKAPKALTFQPQAQLPMELLESYIQGLESFGEYLGGSFLQFSPYVSPKHKRFVFEIIEALPKHLQFAIELRHPDWFSDSSLIERLSGYLQSQGVGFVVTDTPGRRDVLHMQFSARHVMIRFKGNNFHKIDRKRLQDWVSLFQEAPSPPCQIAFFHHHADEIFCLDSIEYMHGALGGDVPGVPKIARASLVQGTLF